MGVAPPVTRVVRSPSSRLLNEAMIVGLGAPTMLLFDGILHRLQQLQVGPLRHGPIHTRFRRPADAPADPRGVRRPDRGPANRPSPGPGAHRTGVARTTTHAELVRAWKVTIAPTVLFLGAGGREVAERLEGGSPDFYSGYLDQRLEQARRAIAG